MENEPAGTEWPVVELRRYTVRAGERARFAEYFDSFFPEAFQQLGVPIFGTFLESDEPARFTWIRGFRGNRERGVADAAFYYGPVWQEHRGRMNDRLADSDDVLQLTPVGPGQGVPFLPAVDPLGEAETSRGGGLAVVFPTTPEGTNLLVEQGEDTLTRQRIAGLRSVALLRSLEAPNSFPQLPVRTDGPFVVWLSVTRNAPPVEPSLFSRVGEAIAQATSRPGTLRGPAQVIALTPTRRSRLRWLRSWDPTDDIPLLSRATTGR